MKKMILIFCSGLVTSAFSQTNTFPASGNVGIGTTSPAYSLDVNGSGRFAGALTGSNATFTGNVNSIGVIRSTGYINPQTGVGLEMSWYPAGQYGQIYAYDRDNQLYKDLYLGSYGNQLVLKSSGNVGIGTATPAYKLDVSGASNFSGVLTGTTAMFTGNVNSVGVVRSTGYTNPQTGIGIEMSWYPTGQYGQIYAYDRDNQLYKDLYLGSNGTQLVLKSRGNVGIGTATPAYRLDVSGTSNFSEVLTGTSATFSGNVGVGTANTGVYKLAVEGTLGARKIKVTQAPTWADYVFDSSYQLKPLAELEKFIKINKHLPDVPSFRQVENDGIDIGDNQSLLLKKIEELTLYIIEMKRNLEKVEKENVEIRQENIKKDDLFKVLLEGNNELKDQIERGNDLQKQRIEQLENKR